MVEVKLPQGGSSPAVLAAFSGRGSMGGHGDRRHGDRHHVRRSAPSRSSTRVVCLLTSVSADSPKGGCCWASTGGRLGEAGVSSPWALPQVKDFEAWEEAATRIGDTSVFGTRSVDCDGCERAVRKPTKWASKASLLIQILADRISGRVCCFSAASLSTPSPESCSTICGHYSGPREALKAWISTMIQASGADSGVEVKSGCPEPIWTPRNQFQR